MVDSGRQDPPGGTGGGSGPGTATDRDLELERLRLEVDRLRAEQASGATARRRSVPWRSIGRWTLLVVGGLLVILSILMIWVRDTLLDTDTWVNTMAPIAASPAVQNAIANDVTTQLFERADLQTKVRDSLPPNAAFLAGPLTNQLRSFSTSAARQLVASDRFQSLWNEVNRRAHDAVVAVLTGEQRGRVSFSGGKVTLDLSSVTSNLQSRLESSGISALQGVDLGNGQVTLVSSPNLVKVQKVTKVMKGIAFVFPVLALGCLAGAVALSRDRRRGLLVAALGLAISMVVLLALLAVLRNIYLDEVVSPRLPSDAASDIYSAIVHVVRQSAQVVFAVGVIVALGAALAGPSRAAVATRRTVRGGLDSLTDTAQARGWDLGPVGIWVGRNRGALRIAILVGAFLVLMIWSQPTAWVVLGLVVIVAVLLALVELLGRAPPPVDEAGTVRRTTPAGPAPPAAGTDTEHGTPATQGPSR